MKRALHPTHRRNTLLGALGSAALALGFGLFGWWAQDNNQQHLALYVGAVGFAVCAIFFVIWAVLRANVMRCPTCGRFLRNWSHSAPGRGKEFHCGPCDTTWDSRIVDDGLD
jgi:hypothetical protein